MSRCFAEFHPGVTIIEADLVEAGLGSTALRARTRWSSTRPRSAVSFAKDFEANNVDGDKADSCGCRGARRAVFRGMSSSVVNSTADDFYTRTKTAQERLFDASPVPHVVLRPTLMFGWFDRKHLGWLRRFMDRARSFRFPETAVSCASHSMSAILCRSSSRRSRQRMTGIYDISGLEQISYGDLIDLIHEIVEPRAGSFIFPTPVLGAALALCAGRQEPALHDGQLEALVIPETFPVIDWPEIFGITATPLGARWRRPISIPNSASRRPGVLGELP